MPSRYTIESVLTECDKIVRVWTDNPTFTLGDITLAGLQGEIAEAREKRERLEALRMQITGLNNDLNAAASRLAAKRTRALSGLRAVYGPNSTQYEQGGGTRQSEKRRVTRKGGNGAGGASK